MEDAQLQSSEPVKSPSVDLGRIGQLMVHRTPDWVKTTSGKLCLLLKKIISSTVAHQHWRVRVEVVELAEHLLDRCSQALGECVGLLLEALVGAINDEEPRVRERFVLIGKWGSGAGSAKCFLLIPGSLSPFLGVKLHSERLPRKIRCLSPPKISDVKTALKHSPTSCQRISTLWPLHCPD